MFKKIAKRIIQKFGYDLIKRSTRAMHSDKPKLIENVPMVNFSISEKERDIGIKYQNSIILSTKHNNLTIKEMRDLEQVWGFADCKTGDVQFFMAIFGNDDGVALRFYNNGHYEKFTTELWTKFAVSSRVILDIGAHTGSYTLSARVANPNSKVISFEPHYLNFGRLALNLRANGFEPLDIFMIAASEINQNVYFQVPKDLGYHSSGGKIANEKISQNYDGYWVNCVSIDSFILGDAKDQIDLVKIDTEGHELKVLNGMADIINKTHPTIFFECITSSNAELEQFFKNHGYNMYCVDDLLGVIEETDILKPYYTSTKQIDMNKLNRIAVHESKVDHSMIIGAIAKLKQ